MAPAAVSRASSPPLDAPLARCHAVWIFCLLTLLRLPRCVCLKSYQERPISFSLNLRAGSLSMRLRFERKPREQAQELTTPLLLTDNRASYKQDESCACNLLESSGSGKRPFHQMNVESIYGISRIFISGANS
eukprot:6183633-Pleurochrysis_carterae.AAC.4